MVKDSPRSTWSLIFNWLRGPSSAICPKWLFSPGQLVGNPLSPGWPGNGINPLVVPSPHMQVCLLLTPHICRCLLLTCASALPPLCCCSCRPQSHWLRYWKKNAQYTEVCEKYSYNLPSLIHDQSNIHPIRTLGMIGVLWYKQVWSQ